MATVVAVLFALGFYGILIWAVRRTRRLAGRSPVVVRHGGVEMRAAALAMTLFPVVLIASTLRPDLRWLSPVTDNPTYLWIAAALFAGGLVLDYAAIRSLGSSFRIGIDPERQGPLVTDGPYRYLRHPIYAAFMVYFVAAWLLQPNLLFGIVTPLAILRILWQANREERTMLAQHGAAYAAYARTTSRFIPFVW